MIFSTGILIIKAIKTINESKYVISAMIPIIIQHMYKLSKLKPNTINGITSKIVIVKISLFIRAVITSFFLFWPSCIFLFHSSEISINNKAMIKMQILEINSKSNRTKIPINEIAIAIKSRLIKFLLFLLKS